MRAFKESARLGYDGLHPYQELPLRHRAQPGARRVPQPRGGDEPVHRQLEAAARAEPPAHDGEEAAPAGSIVGDAPRRGISAEQEFLRQELGRLYAGFVARLDERDRTFFRHRFEEQRTQVEAGQACGLSHMQARTLEKKLRERFLEFMQSNGYLEDYARGGERLKRHDADEHDTYERLIDEMIVGDAARRRVGRAARAPARLRARAARATTRRVARRAHAARRPGRRCVTPSPSTFERIAERGARADGDGAAGLAARGCSGSRRPSAGPSVCAAAAAVVVLIPFLARSPTPPHEDEFQTRGERRPRADRGAASVLHRR